MNSASNIKTKSQEATTATAELIKPDLNFQLLNDWYCDGTFYITPIFSNKYIQCTALSKVKVYQCFTRFNQTT